MPADRRHEMFTSPPRLRNICYADVTNLAPRTASPFHRGMPLPKANFDRVRALRIKGHLGCSFGKKSKINSSFAQLPETAKTVKGGKFKRRVARGNGGLNK